MRILLLTTPLSSLSFDRSAVAVMEPLNLEYIGACVQDHHDVKVVDLRLDCEPNLRQVIESFEPHIVGCAAYTSEVNSAKRVCEEVKRLRPEALVVVGGVHATVMPQDFFEEYVDVVVVGEGTRAFRRICECQQQGTGFDDVENIYFRRAKGVRDLELTKIVEMPALDELPLPARKLTSHVRHQYGNFLAKTSSLALVRSSLGCTFSCRFCAVSAMLNRKMRFHSTSRVLEELEQIAETNVQWTDDELILNTKHAIGLAQEIRRAGIVKEHCFFGRVDSIVRHPEVIEEWAKSGLRSVIIGFESHQENELCKLNKSSGLSRNEECVRICHANGVKVRGSFIVMPEYEEKDFRELGEYAVNLGVDVATYCILTPLPGTALWTDYEGRLTTRNYDYFDLHHAVLPTRLPLRKFYAEFSNLVFNRSYPLGKKLKAFSEIPWSKRIRVALYVSRLKKQFRNAYRVHDHSLW